MPNLFNNTFSNKNKIKLVHYDKGDMDYVLYIPKNMEPGTPILLESNNYETKNTKSLKSSAIQTCKDRAELMDRRCPVLIPVLPSFETGNAYYQQLSKESLKEKRYDEFITGIVQDAKAKLQKEGFEPADKVFLHGYSSSGNFAQRFSMLHPEIIGSAVIGGASDGIPTLSEKIGYPYGIKNFENDFGKPFNKDAYNKIDFTYYVGELEYEMPSEERVKDNGSTAPMHDMSYFHRSADPDTGRQLRKLYGTENENTWNRVSNQIREARSHGVNIEHKFFTNCAHNDRDAQYLSDKGYFALGTDQMIKMAKPLVEKSFNNMISRSRIQKTMVKAEQFSEMKNEQQMTLA